METQKPRDSSQILKLSQIPIYDLHSDWKRIHCWLLDDIRTDSPVSPGSMDESPTPRGPVYRFGDFRRTG